jgi:hypothetical protein
MITRHGSFHCICGVYCGPDRNSWKAHRADRALLSPQDVFITQPIPQELHVLNTAVGQSMKSISLVFDAFKDRLVPVTKALSKLQKQIDQDNYTLASNEENKA